MTYYEVSNLYDRLVKIGGVNLTIATNYSTEAKQLRVTAKFNPSWLWRLFNGTVSRLEHAARLQKELYDSNIVSVVVSLNKDLLILVAKIEENANE